MADEIEKKPWELDYSTPVKSDTAKPWEVDWASYKEPEPKAPARRHIGAVLNDTAIEIANSFASGLGSASDFISPGNSFSQGVKEFVKTGEESQSDVAKAAKLKASTEMSHASTTSEEISAALRNAKENPLLTAGQVFGSMATPMASIKGAGLGAKLFNASEKAVEYAGRGAGVATGAAMSGGDAAGNAYDLVQGIPDDKLLANPEVKQMADSGMSMPDIKKEIATNAARRASIIPAIVGGVSGAFGMEKILASAKAPAKGIGGILATGLAEGAQEAVDEGSSAYTSRLAAKKYDPTIDEFKGVAGNAALGFVMGAGAGSAVHAFKGETPHIGDQINEERQNQLDLHTNELKTATTVDDAIAAAQKLNDVPIHVKTAEDFTPTIAPLTTDQKVEEIRNLSGTKEMQDFMSSLPEDQRSQVMDVISMALSPTAPTRTQAAEDLHQVLTENNVLAAAPQQLSAIQAEVKNALPELQSQVKQIVSSQAWQEHINSLPEDERIEANQIAANALNPLLPAKYRTTLGQTVIQYANQSVPKSVESIVAVKNNQPLPSQELKAQNKLDPVLAPTIIPTEIKSNNPRDIIANSQFEEAIGNLSYVAPELLPKNGDGLTRQAAESIQKLGQALGKNVHFFNQNNAQVRLDGYAHPDHKNDIFVNVGRGDAGWHYVAGHEFFHQLPSELKKSFIESVAPLIPAEKLGKLKDYINQGTLDEVGQWEEIGADLFGNRFGEADFLSKLLGGVKDTPTLLKMVKAIREFVDSVLSSLKTQGFATDKFVNDLQKVRDSAQAILQEHLNQVKETQANVSESAKVEQETTQAKTTQDAQAAIKILEQAGITGKERLDAIKDVKAGTVSIQELESAYPAKIEAKEDIAERERIAAEKEKAFSDYANPKQEELDSIVEAGRDVKVREAEGLTQLQGFDEDVKTAIEEKMQDAVSMILRIPVSKRTSLQKKLLKKFNIQENQKPAPKLKKKGNGVQSLRDSLKRKNPFLAFLAENGINTADRSDVGGQDNKRYFAAGYGAIFRGKGLRLDELAQLAEERGFLTQADVSNESDNGGVNKLADMINQAINGEVVTTGEQDFDFQSYYDDQLKNTALEFGIDIRGKSLDRLAELVNMRYAAMDESTIAAREAEFELQLQEISDDVLEQLRQRSIDNLLDENETDTERTIENDVEPIATVTPKVDKQRNLKEKNFNRREVERILDIPEEKRSKKQVEFLNRNQNKLSSERGSVELDQQIQEAKQKYGIAPTKKNLDALNALLSQVPATVEEDYRGQHRAPTEEEGAAAYDVTSNGIYPDDIYGLNGQRYYGTGSKYDAEAFKIVRQLRGKEDAKVTIYRAVPKDAPDTIRVGDWVAITQGYAKDHGEGALTGDYKIIKKSVLANEIFTNGDSIQEWGYSPKESKRSSERKELPETIAVDGEQRSTKNSNGNPIADTEEKIRNFWKWFGDSSVVDDDGSPLVVYHGTNAEFHTFDNTKKNSTSKANPAALGNWFVGDQNYAKNHGDRVINSYILINNPKVYTRSEWDAVDKNRSFLDLREQLKSSGYDGVIVDKSIERLGKFNVENPALYVSFNPNQIKSATGNEGTFNPENADIRKSTERKEIRDLVITHNLTEANLIHADKMGGIAVPSLAVTNKDYALTNFGEITLIGDKKLADPKGYAKTKVFGADIYSPRYPTVEYEISRKAKADAEKRLANSEKATGSNIDWSDIEKYGTSTLEDSPAMIHAYLESKGIEPNIVYEKAVDPARIEELKAQGLGEYLNVKNRFSLESNPEFKKKAVDAKIAYYEDKAKEVPPFKKSAEELRNDKFEHDRVARDLATEISEIARKSNEPLAPNRYDTRDSLRKQVSGDQDFKSFVQNFMGDIGAIERIFKGYSNSGNRTYQPHTLENVVKILKKELRGGEGFNYGVGSLRAKFTPEFKTIADIRKNKDRLTTADNFKKVKEEIDSDFFAVGEAMGVTRTETVMAILEDAPKMGLDRAAKQYGVELGDNAKEQATEFLNKLKNLPTEYFEAKILRDVDLSEFSGAVVPKGISDKALSILKRNGIPVKEYENDDDRVSAIHDFAVQRDQEKGDILFSKQRNNIDADPELESIFAGLDKSGLARARAQSKLDALPNAKEIQYVQDNFLDILEKLEDAGVLSINCD